jgi:hypothetical protein
MANPGLTVTSTVTGDVNDDDIELIGFVPLPGGEWKAVVTGKVTIDGNIISVTKEFANVPAAVKTYMTNTGLGMAKTGLKSAM